MSGFSGTATLTIATDDQGNGGPAQTGTDTDTVAITVRAAALPSLAIADAVAAEGDAGTRTLRFPVSLAPAGAGTVTVQYATGKGSAVAGADYEATSGTVTFLAGETSKTIDVAVLGDTSDEPDEGFVVTLSDPSGASLGRSQAVGTIVDNDASPGFCSPRPSVTVQAAVEGDTRIRVTVTAGVNQGTPDNRLRELRFRGGDGVVVIGQDGRSGTFTHPLPDRPRSVTFFVERRAPRQPTTVPLDVVDDCPVPWQTFVGAGANVP